MIQLRKKERHSSGFPKVSMSKYLVPLPLEGDLGARLPARLDVDGENLLLLLGSAVTCHHAPRDLHPLRHAL